MGLVLGTLLRPYLVNYRIDSSTALNKVNPKEALAVASLLLAALEQPEYDMNEGGEPTTFGVISLVGIDQALEIDRLLQRFVSPAEYTRRRIVCGNAAQFQGDERDVMFLSLVDTRQNGPLRLREQQMFKQRFNVAASRARDQLWVIHSMNPSADLKPGDLRRRLIEHAKDPNALIRTLDREEKKTQSEFERLVLRRLVAAEYGVVPQWRVGSYRIDLVVQGSNKRLAIECDGDRYHDLEKLREDMERQAVLERLGWTFVRIRGSLFFRDPDRAMQPVFSKLEDLGIPREGPRSSEEASPRPHSELLERIIRRAEELRREWGSTQPVEADRSIFADERTPPIARVEKTERPVPIPQISPQESVPAIGSRQESVVLLENQSSADFIDKAMRKSDNWIRLLRWGRRTGNLSPYDQNLCIRIRQCLVNDQEPTAKLEREAAEVWATSIDRGFHSQN